ncbi:MAG: hypothetical protein ACR2PF_15750 [Rhizobiaceae bacterium]
MNWYTVTKVIKGIPYIYRQRTWRVGKSVKTESVYIGRGDGGGRWGKLTVTTNDNQRAKSVPIGVNTTRLGFHGARNGFHGPPQASDDGQLGAGFYVTTRDWAERFREHSPKTVAYIAHGEEDIEPEFDGDLVEFDIRLLNIKTVASWGDLIHLGQGVLGFDHEHITPEQVEALKEALASEGYDALYISGEVIDDPDGGPDMVQMVVFPEALHRLRRLGAELTLHLNDAKPANTS